MIAKPLWHRVSPVMIIAVAVLLLVGMPAAVSADDMRSLKREYEVARHDQAHTQMGRIVNRMADLDVPEAATFLLKELSDDQAARSRNRAGLPGRLREAVIRALSRFTNEDCIALIGNAALSLRSDRDHALAIDQLDYFLALANMQESAAADEALRKAIADPKNAFVKVAAIEAVRQAGASRLVADVLNVLRETNEDWAKKWLIVPINVFACIEELVEPDDNETVYGIVEAAIAWEERKLCSDERVRYFGGRMLQKLTGHEADMASTFYWKWWVAQKRAGASVDVEDKPDGQRSRTAASPPVFDTTPVGKRMVFVIDVSESMKLPLRIDLDEIERRRKRGPVSGRGRRGPDGEEIEKDPDADNPLRKLPWEDIKTKMDLAREELSRAIREMEGDRQFAIVTYSTQHENLTGGWVSSTPASRKKWSEEAKKLDTDHFTNIHGALLRAMRVNGKGEAKGNPAVDSESVLSGADTIVFLTDGWGSWDDESRELVTDKRNKKERSVGDGPYIYGPDIWPDILRYNVFRKVVINCVGIGNHDVDLLTNLAKRTGGKYVNWGFPED